jgi:hypothetical protein
VITLVGDDVIRPGTIARPNTYIAFSKFDVRAYLPRARNRNQRIIPLVALNALDN